MICLEFGHVENHITLKSNEEFIREQLIKFK